MKQIELDREMQLDPDSRDVRYFENAVARHWSPYDIDLDRDRDRVVELVEIHGELALDTLRVNIRSFGLGEEAVTEDLAPLAIALDDIGEQMFVTTQLYEEAKHTAFFDRYWREVIHPAEDELGLDRSYPCRWSRPEPAPEEGYHYDRLFERNEAAMTRLLDENSPENVARALCHYHLVIEGVLAQTGYYNLHSLYGGDHAPELPNLPGFSDGLANVRSDEGRHVGFGMAKLKSLVTSGRVDPELVHETVDDLLPLVEGVFTPLDREAYEQTPHIDDADLREYAIEKHLQRMRQITDASAEIPDIDELTELDLAGE